VATSADCFRNARTAKTPVTIAKSARTAVAAAVICVATRADMGEAYGGGHAQAALASWQAQRDPARRR
jgi:hypothetical protein